MRIIEKESERAGDGHKRILFALGYEDIEIIHSVMQVAMGNFPRDVHPQTWNRMKSIERETAMYLGLKKEKTPRSSETPCPYCSRKLRGEKALDLHIKDVHNKEKSIESNKV